MYDDDAIMSFLPLCHIFEQLFTILAHFQVGHIVNFIESPDTVVDNMIEISPTVGTRGAANMGKILFRHHDPHVRCHLVQTACIRGGHENRKETRHPGNEF